MFLSFIFFIIHTNHAQKKSQPNHKITKFEFARVVGLRAMDISEGAHTNTPITKTSVERAKEEVSNKTCPPVVLMRYYPDGEVVRVTYP